MSASNSGAAEGDNMQGKETLLWACQIVGGGILLFAGAVKFAARPTDIYIFTELAMEPFGRNLIGFIEVIAGLMLFTRSSAGLGALLGLGVMLGATIAHVSVLGMIVQDDGGMHIAMLGVVVLTTTSVMVGRRKTLPFIGSTL